MNYVKLQFIKHTIIHGIGTLSERNINLTGKVPIYIASNLFEGKLKKY